MNETTKNSAVVDLARYREKVAQKHAKPVQPVASDQLLDVITYHLLMAGRAIAAHTNK